MKIKIWIVGWAVLVVFGLIVCGGVVYRIDPFFHYHAPDTGKFFYTIENERSQNDGITRYFSYDTLITGTSMTENFKTSECDLLFECDSIKVPYSGGTYKEINNSVERAITYNSDLRLVIRGLDMGRFMDSPELLREELGSYPDYLYDNNPFNDIEYVLNRDILFGRVLPMVVATFDSGFYPGITSFDEYARWHQNFTYGYRTVCKSPIEVVESEAVHLSDAERLVIKRNIEQNITDTADKHPDVTFYLFYTPYSIVYWNQRVNDGTIYKQIEAEKYVTELLIKHDNIRVFSFNENYDIITDLNNYKDARHYASWINSLMLKWMHDGEGLLTEENYKTYIENERNFYTSFDYESINGQEDYASDDYAAALLNNELTGAKPEELLDGDMSLSVGEAICFDYRLDNGHNFFVFHVAGKNDNIMPKVGIYDEEGNCLVEIEVDHGSTDQTYVIDLSNLTSDGKYFFKVATDNDTEFYKLKIEDVWLY